MLGCVAAFFFFLFFFPHIVTMESFYGVVFLTSFVFLPFFFFSP